MKDEGRTINLVLLKLGWIRPTFTMTYISARGTLCFIILSLACGSSAFQNAARPSAYAFHPSTRRSWTPNFLSSSPSSSTNNKGASSSGGDEKPTGDNKAMQFLKKIGKVGGAANRDFRYAIGVDEGLAGKSAGDRGLKKTKAAFRSCVETGVVDDMSEAFPQTSSGTRWSGFT